MEINDTLGQSVTHRDATLRLLSLKDWLYYERATYRVGKMRKAAEWIDSVGRKASKARSEMMILVESKDCSDLPDTIADLSCLPTRFEEYYAHQYGKYLPKDTVEALIGVVGLAKEATDQWLEERRRFSEIKLALVDFARDKNFDKDALMAILGDAGQEKEDLMKEIEVWQELEDSTEDPLLWLLDWKLFLGIQDVRN